jgi:maleate cis-trans isomerase
MTRLGFVYPGGGAEHDYYRFAETHGFQVFLAGSRTPGGDDHSIDSLLRTARTAPIVESAKRLMTLRVDAILWACTSGSFILGRAGAEAQAKVLREATGKPATSTSLAFIAALNRLGAQRVAVLATYPEPASRAFAAFLSEYGFTVADLRWLDAPSGFDAANIDEQHLAATLSTIDLTFVEAVLIPDTALASLDLVDRLEGVCQRPVLTANQVTLWAALGLAGQSLTVSGFGRIFKSAAKEICDDGPERNRLLSR